MQRVKECVDARADLRGRRFVERTEGGASGDAGGIEGVEGFGGAEEGGGVNAWLF